MRLLPFLSLFAIGALARHKSKQTTSSAEESSSSANITTTAAAHEAQKAPKSCKAKSHGKNYKSVSVYDGATHTRWEQDENCRFTPPAVEASSLWRDDKGGWHKEAPVTITAPDGEVYRLQSTPPTRTLTTLTRTSFAVEIPGPTAMSTVAQHEYVNDEEDEVEQEEDSDEEETVMILDPSPSTFSTKTKTK